MFVFLSHVPILPGMATIAGDRLMFNAGVVGVSFFFVLSGFILTYNYAELFQSGVSSADHKRFVWDRFTKIYPVHIAALLLVAPMSILSQNLPFLWAALPFHLLLLQCFWPSPTPAFYEYLNVPSWSISCEWFFYLLAPTAMFLVLGSARQRLLIVAAVAVYAGGLGWLLWSGASDVTRLYMVSWFAPSRFVEFTVGMFLARGFLNASWKTGGSTAGFAQVAGVLLIVAGAMSRRYAPWPLWGGLLYVPGSALLVLSLAVGRGFLAAHLSRPWLQQLGTASFSFYLIHAPMLRYVRNVARILGWEAHSWIDFWVVTIVMFVVIQTSAFVLCHCYEIPVQKRLRASLPAARPNRPPRSARV